MENEEIIKKIESILDTISTFANSVNNGFGNIENEIKNLKVSTFTFLKAIDRKKSEIENFISQVKVFDHENKSF